MDMSNNAGDGSGNDFDELDVVILFGKIRRQLNLRATQALKPMGLGPKQAVLLRELAGVKAASPMELARLTQTDPASTGRIIESLIRKQWAKRTDHPDDRRSWKVSLTERGLKAARQLDGTWRVLANDFCGHLAPREKKTLFELFSRISLHLEDRLEAAKDVS